MVEERRGERERASGGDCRDVMKRYVDCERKNLFVSPELMWTIKVSYQLCSRGNWLPWEGEGHSHSQWEVPLSL